MEVPSSVDIKKDVRQGCGVLLFHVYAEALFREAFDENGGTIKTNGIITINNIQYIHMDSLIIATTVRRNCKESHRQTCGRSVVKLLGSRFLIYLTETKVIFAFSKYAIKCQTMINRTEQMCTPWNIWLPFCTTAELRAT